MYYDLLVRIKNIEGSRRRTLRIPFSNMDFAVAKVLVDTGHLKGVKKKAIDRKSFLEIELLTKNKTASPLHFKVLSKPSRRFYVDYRKLRPVRQGYGVGIISTSKGVMTTREAKKQKVGGEYLVEVW